MNAYDQAMDDGEQGKGIGTFSYVSSRDNPDCPNDDTQHGDVPFPTPGDHSAAMLINVSCSRAEPTKTLVGHTANTELHDTNGGG